MNFPRKTFSLASLALAAALILSGCASNNDGAGTNGTTVTPAGTQPATTEMPTAPSAADVAAVDAINVSGPAGSEPTVEFTHPLDVSYMTIRLVQDGTGAALEDGQLLTIDVAAWQGSDGEPIFSTWEDGTSEVFTLGGGQWAVLNDVLTGTHVGARVLIANPTALQGEELTVVSIFEVTNARPPRAAGDAVAPPEGLPVVTLAANGEPSIEIPEGYQPPDELVAQTLVRGDGPVVMPNSFLTVHYTGWLLNGEVFDSSWARNAPAGLPLPNVIEGWREGLAGQTVGSQVLLVIPPEMAYGDDGQGAIPPGSTLVFVVDILNAS